MHYHEEKREEEAPPSTGRVLGSQSSPIPAAASVSASPENQASELRRRRFVAAQAAEARLQKQDVSSPSPSSNQ